jgi:uncharacterized protein
MSGVALLDVNVLVSLFDPDHVHHDVAHDWFADRGASGWATCPLTENGFLRVAGRVARAREFVSVSALIDVLRRFCSSSAHEFWSDDASLLDERSFNAALARGHQQLTDVYLLGLAVKHKGVLATFDQHIALAAVNGARREHLALITSTA